MAVSVEWGQLLLQRGAYDDVTGAARREPTAGCLPPVLTGVVEILSVS